MKPLCLILFALRLCAQNCASPVTLTLNTNLSGTLDPASCTLSDGTAEADFRIVIPVRGMLKVTVSSGDFTPMLTLRDADTRKVVGGALLARYVEAGVYELAVAGANAGVFTLQSTFEPEPNVLCTIFGKLGVGRTISSQLTANSCKLPDATLFESWQTTVYGAGTLTIKMRAASFDSFLILRGENGNLLASDDNDGGGRDAQIVLAVSGRETYSIVAAGADATAKGGAYQISVDFVPNDDETCRPVAILTEAGTATGSISTASCNFNLPGRQDSSLFNVYGVHVTDDGVAQISIPAATFTPLLLVLDADGYPVAEDSESGGLYTPQIRRFLKAGEYSLLVFNEDSFEGDYTLQYGFTAVTMQPCASQALGVGDLSGTLSANGSCRSYDLLSNLYSVNLATACTLEISLASGDFTTFLELRDAHENLLAYGDQNGDGSSAHLQATLPAGAYQIIAASTDLPGSYSLHAQITPRAVPPCPAAQTLAVNTGYLNKLGTSGCLGSAGEAVDRYEFTLTGDGTVALVLTSMEFDGNLTLLDSAGTPLRFDDNSYVDGDALIVQYLKAGVYRVEARGKGVTGAGRYRVDLLWSAGAKPPYCAAAPLVMGASVSSVLTYTGCQYYDGTFADFYRFQVTDPSKPIDAGVTADFDSYLVLIDAKGNAIASDDNSGGGTDARLSVILDAGTYFLIVKPADDATQSGPYRLYVRQ